MRCHYEVLNIPRTADDAEIKTAYRKLALKWHPDKNLENSEYAKEQFQGVQQAYEVLSDRQERAWYDNHREQILHGSSSEFEDNSLDVFQYFTNTCFKGYGDDDNGFYMIYRNVFETIATEDMKFMDAKEEFCEIPSFGNSKTDYEKVSEFYAYWLNYATKKSYVWLDPYDIRETKDRRYIKLVEKENKKVRQKAKKERNEEIRSLVAFVRKRDKRVQAYKKIQEQKLLEDKNKRESLRKQKQLERQEQLNTSAAQPEWAKFDNVKSELEEIERNLAEQFGEKFSNSECEEDDLNSLYCVACNKVFKTPKAFENHELSKKHKENIEILKETMLEEEENLDEDSNISENLEDYHDLEDDHRDIDLSEDKIENSITDSDSESLEEVTKNKQKKKRKPRNVLVIDQHASDVEESIAKVQEFEDGIIFAPNKKQKKKNKKNANKSSVEPPENENEEKLNGENIPSLNNTSNVKKNKNDTKTKKDNETELFDVDTNHICVTCRSNFPSKNKLFDHLKKTSHGVYIPSKNVKNKSRRKNVKEK